MYNSKDYVVDKDLTFLSYNQTIDGEFTVENILESDLWITENVGNSLIKAIPLFNCDSIISSNEADMILDMNKCIILQNDEDTIIRCISKDMGKTHYYDVQLFAYSIYNELDVIDDLDIFCIVYDKYLNTLDDIDVEVYVNGKLVDIVKTDTNGVCKFNVTKFSVVKFVYGNDESNQIIIYGDEVYDLTIETDKQSLYVDESVTISGVLTVDGEVYTDQSINLYDGNTKIDTLVTDSDGEYTKTVSNLSEGSHIFRAVHNRVESETVSVTVNTHSYNLSIESNKENIYITEPVTVSGVLLKDGEGYANQTVTIYDGTTSKGTCTTDSNGAYSKTVTDLAEGSHSLKAVTSDVESEVKTINVNSDVVIATVTGNTITLGRNNVEWLSSTNDVMINWGDGSYDIVNNPTTALRHTYNDGLSSHDIIFAGEVTELGDSCIGIPNLTSIEISSIVTRLGYKCFATCRNLTTIVIPDGVNEIGGECFTFCPSLSSITIPDSVTTIGRLCFYGCSSLLDYQLYWTEDDIINYNEEWSCPPNAVFTIPQGQTANYEEKNYPPNRLVERGLKLTLACPTPIIQKTDTATITATLKDGGSVLTGETLSYEIKYDTTTIDSGTKTTNNNGQAIIQYTGTGIGDVSVIISYDSLEETYEITDYIRYDDGSTDKSSNYSYDNLNSFAYVTDHYEANRTLGTAVSTFYSPIYVDDTLPADFEISVDISCSNIVQYGISIASNHPQTYQNTTEFGILANARRETIFSRLNGSGTFKNDYNYNLSTNDYYTFKIKVEGTTLTGTITDSNNVVKYTNSMEVSYAQSHKKWSIIVGENENTVSFKNLRIKAL